MGAVDGDSDLVLGERGKFSLVAGTYPTKGAHCRARRGGWVAGGGRWVTAEGQSYRQSSLLQQSRSTVHAFFCVVRGRTIGQRGDYIDCRTPLIPSSLVD